MKKIFLATLVLFVSTEIIAQEVTLDKAAYQNNYVGSPTIIYKKGPTGFQGSQGKQGIKGDKGRPGGFGYSGSVGKTGKPGKPGAKGKPGTPGKRGARGEDVYYYSNDNCGRHQICPYSIEKSKGSIQ